jgi:hypothetical protein
LVFDLLEPETHSPEVFRKRGRVHREVLGRNEVMEGRAGFLLEAGFDQCLVLGRELANLLYTLNQGLNRCRTTIFQYL